MLPTHAWQSMIRIQRLVLAVCALALLPACARHSPGGGPVPDAGAGVADGGAWLPPEQTGAAPPAAQVADRPIAPDDVLDITVFGAEEFTRSVRVSAGGDISLPLIGVVRAAGQTPRELEEQLRTKLKSYMHEPNVSVEVKELATAAIYVVGEVNQPGAFVLNGRTGLTVLQAASMARGWKATSSPNRAVVIRTDPRGERVQIPIDVSDIVRGKMPDLALQANDVLYIPKNTEKAVALGVVDTLLRMVTFRAAF
jgi:polysaccharide export outer membrane protein